MPNINSGNDANHSSYLFLSRGHNSQAHRVVFRVRFVLKVAEVDLVAPVDVVVQVFVFPLVQLLRNSNLPRSCVQGRPQDLHCLLRVELFSEDLLELDHLLL